jgi:hypothetical protein
MPGSRKRWLFGRARRFFVKSIACKVFEKASARGYHAEAIDSSGTRLRNVVADRGPDHVIHRLGGKAWGSGRVVITRPAVLGKVRVLEAKPESAFRSLVELVPEPQRGLRDNASVASAARSRRRRERS